jgi:hypothetical protein
VDGGVLKKSIGIFLPAHHDHVTSLAFVSCNLLNLDVFRDLASGSAAQRDWKMQSGGSTQDGMNARSISATVRAAEKTMAKMFGMCELICERTGNAEWHVKNWKGLVISPVVICGDNPADAATICRDAKA